MKKCFIVTAMLFAAMMAFGQEKPSLGILPFTGGSGHDGDTIADLFSNSAALDRAFAVITRTSSAQAIDKEHEIQRTVLTDSDEIAEMGKQMEVAYVVSGHITRFENKNLLLISIVNVDTMEEIAGDYREYGGLAEIRKLLPSMAEKIVSSVQKGASTSRDGLAVLPLNIRDQDVKQNDAEFLAQILSIEIANTHRYAVLPRTKTIMDAAKLEKDVQNSGYTSPENLAAIGRATKARYVLSGTITRLGDMNLFDVKILDIKSGRRVDGGGKDKEYQNLADGIKIMPELALEITGVKEENDRAIAEQKQREAELAAEQSRREAKEKKNIRSKPIGFDISCNFVMRPRLGAAVNLNFFFSFLPYTFFDIGVDAYGSYSSLFKEYYHSRYDELVHYIEERSEDIRYTYPYIHYNAYLPIADGYIGIYAGAGAGYMAIHDFTPDYTLVNAAAAQSTFTYDLQAGIHLTFFKIGYSLRVPVEPSASLIHVLVLGVNLNSVTLMLGK